MKITSETQLMNGPTTSQQQSADFERWLRSPTQQTQGDEYYRAHQTQLQHSELRFNSVINATQTPPCDREQPIIKTPAPSLPITTTTAPISDNQDNPCPLLPYTDMQALPLTETVIRTVKSATILYSDQTEKTLQEEIQNPVRPTTTTQVLRLAVPEKNHHLYKHQNEVELALNTKGLSTEESTELQTLIKQWLTRKGYTLKQLIINGEKQ
ncbi:MAG: hypothetical protein OJI67_08465 [Prosthecobacter sp.]|nr:hypothetical protein [Prosthecobacter sp.]